VVEDFLRCVVEDFLRCVVEDFLRCVVEDSFLVVYGAASLSRVSLPFQERTSKIVKFHHNLNNVSASNTRITYAAEFVCCHQALDL
jgi:hypothetical protein